MTMRFDLFWLAVLVGSIFACLIQETNGFFIKHVQSGKCINDTGMTLFGNFYGIGYYLNLTNNCFDPTTQFKFHQSGSILKPNRQGCLVGDRQREDLFLIYENKGNIAAACNDANALTQTFQGGIFTSDFNKCAVPPGYIKRHVYMGIAKCNNEEDQQFHFGAVTRAGQKIADASCSNNQFMVIKVAEYRGLRKGSICNSSLDYNCSVDVTCDLKKYCDGERECTITVDDNHFPSNICPGLEKYLYFEYQCNDTSMPYRKIGHLPDGPPLNVTIYAIGNTSLFVTWKPPDVTKRNGKIVSYTVCIKQCGGDTCSKTYTTEEQHLEINHLKPATKYCVRVLASTKVGPGIYSKLKWTFSNGLAPEQPRIQTAYSLTYLLRIPSIKYQYFYVVAMEHDKKESRLPSELKNDDLVSYSEAISSAQPKPYIAAVIFPIRKNTSLFTLGDVANTVVTRRRRSDGRKHQNGPLKPGTSYKIFQRVFVDDQVSFYSTDWSPPAKTLQNTDIPATTKWYIILVAVISGIILIIVSCSIILLYRRRFVLNNKSKQNEQLQSPGVESTDVNNGAYEEMKLSDISKRNDNEALTDRDDLNYQKLDVSKMDREENYQSLMDMPYVNIKDKTYQD
ncbi:uncharacterized protein LOC124451778 isoform X2 [Xenia sp. Carnegie-2017]|uniref:uncharacterized protein LOC124451778 isoform X2 n=1 Tax=Xenia sp. Carnegie-2017 TaxID=2897299 RepID=UPI001F0436A0|nr:uncharacterized protein LOC124451778 isoform X2 [Xenia sp. Carnegie-2017]